MGDGHSDATTDRTGPSRRDILAGAAGLGGVLAMGGVAWQAPAVAMAPDGAGIAPAAESGGVINLMLDGTQNALLKSADGGGPVAEVVTGEPSGGVVPKHIGNVKYDDITVKLGRGMGKSLRLWLMDTMLMKAPTRSGSINFSHDGIIQKLDFTNALITEIGFPALDATSKDPAYMTLKFSPEAARYSPKGGTAPTSSTSGKNFLPSNFKFEITGLDCKKVSKIDSFTVKQTIVYVEKGREPGKLEFPNIKWEGPDLDAASAGWIDWAEDFIVKGNNSAAHERTAKISYMNATLDAALMTVDLKGCGPISLQPDAFNPKELNLRRISVEMYCESIVSKFA